MGSEIVPYADGEDSRTLVETYQLPEDGCWDLHAKDDHRKAAPLPSLCPWAGFYCCGCAKSDSPLPVDFVEQGRLGCFRLWTDDEREPRLRMIYHLLYREAPDEINSRNGQCPR